MPHVELPTATATDAPAGAPDALRGWVGMVRRAQDACLVLGDAGTIAACSPPVVPLLGLPDPVTVVGRLLTETVAHLIGFTGAGTRLSDWEAGGIPPLRALATGTLARGLLRIRTTYGVRTIDAVATPLRYDGAIAGSLTFFQQL